MPYFLLDEQSSSQLQRPHLGKLLSRTPPMTSSLCFRPPPLHNSQGAIFWQSSYISPLQSPRLCQNGSLFSWPSWCPHFSSRHIPISVPWFDRREGPTPPIPPIRPLSLCTLFGVHLAGATAQVSAESRGPSRRYRCFIKAVTPGPRSAPGEVYTQTPFRVQATTAQVGNEKGAASAHSSVDLFKVLARQKSGEHSSYQTADTGDWQQGLHHWPPMLSHAAAAPVMSPFEGGPRMEAPKPHYSRGQTSGLLPLP